MMRCLAKPAHEAHWEKDVERVEPLRRVRLHEREGRKPVEARAVDEPAHRAEVLLHRPRHRLDGIRPFQVKGRETRMRRAAAQGAQTVRAARDGKDRLPTRDEPPRDGFADAARGPGHDRAGTAHAVTPANAAKSATVSSRAKSPAATGRP